MRTPRLFCPTLSPGQALLPPEESHHAANVLRLAIGQQVVLFDGAGLEAIGRVKQVESNHTCVDVTQVIEHPFELPCRITLAVAPVRTHRQGYLIEKCTECGVAAIWPILADRSVARPAERAIEKWTRRAIEASKQSGRVWVPRIAAPQPFDSILERIREFDASVVLHSTTASRAFDALLAECCEDGSMLVWIGPEGGWSDDELERLDRAGVPRATLGPTNMRTETAAVAACAAAALAGVRRNTQGS